jgi:hypothetical protein
MAEWEKPGLHVSDWEMNYAYLCVRPDVNLECENCPIFQEGCTGINLWFQTYHSATLELEGLPFRDDIVARNEQIYNSKDRKIRDVLREPIRNGVRRWLTENGATCSGEF